jgi:hypothetical protein
MKKKDQLVPLVWSGVAFLGQQAVGRAKNSTRPWCTKYEDFPAAVLSHAVKVVLRGWCLVTSRNPSERLKTGAGYWIEQPRPRRAEFFALPPLRFSVC